MLGCNAIAPGDEGVSDGRRELLRRGKHLLNGASCLNAGQASCLNAGQVESA